MKIPFSPGRLALRKEEREWFHKVLSKKYKATNILEFGCGVSTWLINDALKPKSYTAVEEYQPNIDLINKHCPNVKIVDNWDFGDQEFDFVFVDSSAGSKLSGMHREKTIMASEPFMTDDCIVIIHDWNTKLGSKAREYLKGNGYELLDSTPVRKGIGIYRKPKQVMEISPSKSPKTSGDKYSDITVVTACDEKHIKRLEVTLPTWIKLKGVTCPILVFAHNVDPEKTSISSYSNVKIIPWDLDTAETQREKMLSSFVFGAAEHVKTDYWLKLDSDTIALNNNPWLDDSFFDYDMIGQKWGYSKPGSMVPRIDYWLDGLHKIGAIKNFGGVEGKYVLVGDENKPHKMKHQAIRVISWIRLTKTELVRKIAECCHYGRMPVPSEDTLVWRWCDKLGLNWQRHDFKQYGWDHDGRNYKEKADQALSVLA